MSEDNSQNSICFLAGMTFEVHSGCFCFMIFICDPYITYAFSSLAAGTYPAFPSIPFNLRAHVIVDHRHGHGIQRLIVPCVWTERDMHAQGLNVADIILD